MTDVVAAQNGDLAAFGRLVDHWSATVTSIALSIVGDISESEEVAQEVFVTVWKKLRTLESPESFGAWLRQTTRNRALTHRRCRERRWRRVVPDPEADGIAPDPMEGASERQAVQDALDALPDDARDVMILFYREGQSVRQVATLLELSESAVKKRLSRARNAIRADVQVALGRTLVQTAPGVAFTTVVLSTLTPSSAHAAVAGATGSTTTGAVGFSALLLVVLGYRLAEEVTPTDRHPLLHRARDLTIAGLSALLVGAALGPIPSLMGFGIAAVLLTWVQFRILPVAFAQDTPSRAERMGRICGVLGLLAGLTFGLAGLLHG